MMVNLTSLRRNILRAIRDCDGGVVTFQPSDMETAGALLDELVAAGALVADGLTYSITAEGNAALLPPPEV